MGTMIIGIVLFMAYCVWGTIHATRSSVNAFGNVIVTKKVQIHSVFIAELLKWNVFCAQCRPSQLGIVKVWCALETFGIATLHGNKADCEKSFAFGMIGYKDHVHTTLGSIGCNKSSSPYLSYCCGSN